MFRMENGEKTSDEDSISNMFHEFFGVKVADLSAGQDQYCWARSDVHPTYTEADVLKALTTYKRKISSDSDNIMMLMVKDSLPGVIKEFTHLMNLASSNGIPQSWKLAKVLPLHKKGAKDEIQNYRPIANLQSARSMKSFF